MPESIALELGSDPEIHKLKEGFYLLSKKLELIKEEDIVNKYLDLLYEILKLPYNKRNLNYIVKVFGEERVKQIYELKRYGILQIYKKDNKDFIGFPNSIYKKITRLDKMKSFGILKIDEYNKFLSTHPYINNYINVIDFDGYVYFISPTLFRKYYSLIINIFNKESVWDYESLLNKLKIHPDLLTILLKVIAEKGELIEIKRNVYERI